VSRHATAPTTWSDEVISMPLASGPRRSAAPRRGTVEFAGDRSAFVAALRRGDEGAAAALFHEYSPLVERTIGRILNVNEDLPDATQEAFLRAIRSVHRLREPQALTDWLLQIAVCTAVDWVRKRRRRRWLTFVDPVEVPEQSSGFDEAGRDVVRATYRVLERMSVEERTVFALRHIDGMELTQLATVCKCSLATIKRRLVRADARFEALTQHEPALLAWRDERAEPSSERQP